MNRFFLLLIFGFGSLTSGLAQTASNRYILILEDAPVSARFQSRDTLASAGGRSYRQTVQAKQQNLRQQLQARKITVTGSVDTVLNAVFVVTTKDRVDELKSLPGVIGVAPVRRFQQNLNRATQILNAPAAWNALSGSQNAGKGIKIAILDSGIDQTHPAFQDSSLPMPSGYPMCSGDDCAFTNNKVIVARSYVRQLAAGGADNPPADSRPDDYSARDRGGHGTAVASCAAGNTATGPAVTITGMAPKAYLGNYKIYGSPWVNDFTFDDVIIAALEDAIHDGMDIISFSTGGAAFYGATDTGAACGLDPGVPCDPSGMAFENAAKSGTIIVAAAGNGGYDPLSPTLPILNSIGSPANAPSVISVGATTNSHTFMETVQVTGSNAPSNLTNIAANPDLAYIATGSYSLPLRDVASLGNDGLACSALPAGSLGGAFALIKRGTCTFATKLTNAVSAGAEGAIFYMADQSPLAPIGDLYDFFVPALMISNNDGVALKNFIAANPEHAVTINPAGVEQQTSTANQVPYFSSLGPTTGDSAIKPDVVAVGANLYMAAQKYDPLGELYSADGFGIADGTSFSTPLTAGAAALVKQAHPGFSAAQVKSALVNLAAQDVTQDDSGNTVDVRFVGGGKVDAGAAVGATVTSDPATLSFGAIASGSLPISRQFQITNSGSSTVSLTIAIASGGTTGGATLAFDKQTLSLAAGASSTLTASLSGTVPGPGVYSGAVAIQGTGVSLRIPYLFIVGDGAFSNFIALSGENFEGTVGQGISAGIISFKVIDRFGLPVAGAPVSWIARNGATLSNSSAATDKYGIAATQPLMGSTAGAYSVTAVVAGQRFTFQGFARAVPNATSILEGATFDPARPIAPGSYVSIKGTGLSDDTGQFAGSGNLPLAIDGVIVSFDVPSANLSLPGHLTYVSAAQVNVQVPWELQGISSALVKVTIDFSNGNVVSVPLADYSPGFFGGDNVAALNGDYRVVTASNPAKRGQIVQLYANGLGPVTNQPKSGEPALVTPLSETKTVPTVMFGNQQAVVQFSGLAPGFAGLYQVNVTVPAGLASGTYPVTVAIGGQTSKSSNIFVQ